MELAIVREKKPEEYRYSGFEWIGKIPVHWKVERGKWLFKKNTRPVRSEDKIITCFRDGQVTLRENRRKDGFTNALKEHGYQGVRKGDLVIHAMDAFAGAIGVSDSDGKSTPVYSVCTERVTNTVNSYFYAYYLRNLALNGVIESLAKGIRERSTDFRFNDFGNLEIAVPPINEQTAIADFLDDKTAKIDTAIAQKERLIELLTERKQIIIQKVVTKGLDPKVKYKDSGIEWIGEIPEHWEKKRFRFIFSLGKGLTITKENLKDEGVYCVNYGEIHSKYGFEVNPEIHSLKCVDEEYIKQNKDALINKGDFLFADTSEDIEGSGNFTYLNSNKRVFAGYHTVTAKLNRIINPRFLAYEFDSVSFRNQVRFRVKGVKVYSITQSLLKEPTIWIPTIKEQEAIVEYLDLELKGIENSINLQLKLIKRLKEYKASLIDSAVTGKIKVE